MLKSPLVNKINEVFANGGTGGNNAPSVSISSPNNNTVFNLGDDYKYKCKCFRC